MFELRVPRHARHRRVTQLTDPNPHHFCVPAPELEFSVHELSTTCVHRVRAQALKALSPGMPCPDSQHQLFSENLLPKIFPFST
jgi:hypothetical protein